MSDGEALARIEGKIDVLNERHTGMAANMASFNSRLADHGSRLNELEKDGNIFKGERKGSQRMLNVMYGLATLMGVSGTAAIIKTLIMHN